jgi:hypothetical protein
MNKIKESNETLFSNRPFSGRELQLKAKEVAKKFSPKLNESIKVRLDEKTIIFFKQGTSSKDIENKLQKFRNAKLNTEIVYF